MSFACSFTIDFIFYFWILVSICFLCLTHYLLYSYCVRHPILYFYHSSLSYLICLLLFSPTLTKIFHDFSNIDQYDLPQGEKKHGRKDNFITYNIFQNLPFKGEGCDNRTIHDSFSKCGVLDFHAQIKTNLNILYVGSSVGVQFTRALSEAAIVEDRQVVRWAWNRWNENTQISRTPDGGTIAGIRVTGLFLKSRKDYPRHMAPNGGGGWLSHDVREMKRLVHQWQQVEPIDTAYGEKTSPCEIQDEVNVTRNATTENSYNCKEKNFDVVVHQLPLEWEIFRKGKPSLNASLTWEILDEIVHLSFDYLGASTVILQTSPIQNNVKNLSDLVLVNKRIWDYVREFDANTYNATGNVFNLSLGNNTNVPKRKVLVMDIFAYSVFMFLQNSIEIGLLSREKGQALKTNLNQATNANTFLEMTMELDHAGAYNRTIKVGKHPRHVGQYCGDIDCRSQSLISRDGIHFCMRETGGRINAGLACLVQCSINDEGVKMKARECEKRCNSNYMSLNLIPWEKGQEIDAFNVSTKLIGLENY